MKAQNLQEAPHKAWDGQIPERRYALFTGTLSGDYMVLVKGDDLNTAPRWGGFVQWVGGMRPAEKRRVS